MKVEYSVVCACVRACAWSFVLAAVVAATLYGFVYFIV